MGLFAYGSRESLVGSAKQNTRLLHLPDLDYFVS